MALLNEVDVSGIEPTAHAFPVTNVWAEDVPAARPPGRGGAAQRPREA